MFNSSYYFLLYPSLLVIAIIFYAYLRREAINKSIHIHIAKWVEAYIHKNHSDKFIHVDNLKDTITKHIAHRERQIIEQRDKEERLKLDAQFMNFSIMEAGWIAEIEGLEKDNKKLNETLKSWQQMYYAVQSEKKELCIITSRNEAIVKEVAENMTIPLGKLESVNRDLNDLQINPNVIPDEFRTIKQIEEK
jgi:hypothetical protein